MKRLFLPVVLFFLMAGVYAQQTWVGIDNASHQPAEITMLSGNEQSTKILFTLDGFLSDPVKTPKGIEQIISIGNGVQITEQGAPDLAKLVTAIIIPDQDKMEVVINRSRFVDFEDIEVAPSKGHFTRDIRPEDVPFVYGDMYQDDGFWPKSLANLEDPFIMRDFRGQTVTIFPFQYNAVTKTLRVYYEIEAEVVSTGQIGENILNRTRQLNSMDSEFRQIYSRMFLNKEAQTKNRYIVDEEGSLLIIVFDEFAPAMEPFVNWKRTIGRKTKMVLKSEVGTTAAAIKTYVQNYYNNNSDFTHLLLIGDAPQIPTNTLSTGHSDNAYGYLVGTDSYNEIFVGRFSAETIAHVETQVQRMIEYERDINTSDTWLSTGMGIARNEGAGGGHFGEADYVHMNFIRDSLLNFTYDIVYQEYDGNAPGYTNTTAAQISAGINNGVSIINFCNHGSNTGWSVAGYSSSHVNQLTNIGKLPFIWSVACVNGNFVSLTCFAETWLRATHEGEPTGAIGTMMSTINQAWQPPMTGQDEMVTILVEKRDHIRRTFGGLSINGSMKMIGSHGASGIETHDTWTLFGDPTLLVRTNVPEEMIVSHNPTLFLGSSTFTVNCDVDDALVAISYEDEDGAMQLLATAVVEGGVANIVFDDPIVQPLDLTVAITAFNKVTYLGELMAVPADEPYIVLDGFSATAAPDYGQTIGLDVVLKNISEDPYTASNVTAQISTENPQVTILTVDPVAAGTIEPDQVVEIENAFQFTIADDITNQTPMVFTITFAGQYDGEDYQWQQNFTIRANAPILEIGGLAVNDLGSGNGDGVLDPGETASLILTIMNKGAAAIDNMIVEYTILSDGANHLTVNSIALSGEMIPAGGSITATLNVTADEETDLGTPVNIAFNVTGGLESQYSAQGEKEVIIGFVPEYCVSGATNPGDTRIHGFSFGELQNITNVGCATYNNFTENPNLIKEFVIGATYDIGVTLGTCGGNYSKGAKVFVDWNYNGLFTDAGEMVFYVPSQNANWTATGTVTIPTTASPGQKFLRVVVREGGDASTIAPCGTFSYGETQDYKIVLVLPQEPVADFEAYPTQTVENDIVSFTDKSLNHPAGWSWAFSPGDEGTDFEFVDGTTNTSKNPKVKFITPNVYTVSLTTTNLAGSNTLVKENYVTITQLTVVPVANFSATPTQLMGGQTVQFTDMSTNLPIAWNWTITPGEAGTDFNFVNGTTPESKNPSVVFNTGGSYTIQLVATNPVGNSDPHIKVDYIEVVPTFLMSNGEATVCSGMFFDSGGPNGMYSINENYVFTFHPGMENSNIKVQFQTFNVEHHSTCNFDWLKVYDGSDTDATLLGTFCGNTAIPGPFVATDGSLTFHFKSDGFVNAPGWSAVVSCHGPFYDVAFEVTGPDGPIEGALIQVDGHNLHTEADGAVEVNLQAGNHSYIVTKDGYSPVNGNVSITEEMTVPISMIPLHSVVFTVTANGSPAHGAMVEINGLQLYCNQDGHLQTTLPQGTYDYTITMDGYLTAHGQVVVDGALVEVEINMLPLFVVTFQVATSGGPLYQAEIKVGGHTLHTNDTGHTDVALPPGSYPYEVTYMDFPTITGNINIADENVFVGVLLETSISDLAMQEVKLFPNPFRAKIFLTGTTELKEVIVTNLNGQEVARIASNGSDSMQIETGSLPSGVYLVKLVGKSNEVFIHKMVKQ